MLRGGVYLPTPGNRAHAPDVQHNAVHCPACPSNHSHLENTHRGTKLCQRSPTNPQAAEHSDPASSFLSTALREPEGSCILPSIPERCPISAEDAAAKAQPLDFLLWWSFSLSFRPHSVLVLNEFLALY